MIFKNYFRILGLLTCFLGMVLVLITVKPADGSALPQHSHVSQSSFAALPEVFFVTPSGAGTGNCSNWSNACSLQDALDIAENRDEIWVKAGVHLPGIRPTATFSLVDGVKVFGGFDGTETARYQRDWLTNITVLSGDIGGDDITDPTGVVTDTDNLVGSNAYHVVSALSVESGSILDGFVITAGLANRGEGAGLYNTASPTLCNLIFSGNYAQNGAGIYNHNDSSPSLTNVTISNNKVSNSGGGMYSRSGSNPILTDVIISGNQAGVSGGGLYNTTESNPTLTNVTIHGNYAVEAGGGIYNLFSSPILVNSLISDNISGNDGGGIHNDLSSSPTLTDVTISGNRAEGYGGDGGGIYNATNSSPILTRVILSRNYASSGGGAIQNDDTNSPILTDVIVVGNEAGFTGGGILNRSGGSSTLTNVLISGNLAQMGGGIINCNICLMTLTNVTISGNRADYGGGIYNYSHHPVINNSIIWNNYALSGTGSLYNTDDTLPIIRNSDIQGCGGSSAWDTECGTDGGGNIDADPLFRRPLNPLSAPSTSGDLYLQFPSPAIDAGDNSAVPGGVTTDLMGIPRFIDIPAIPDTGNGSSPIVDMGAYEFIFQGFIPLVLR